MTGPHAYAAMFEFVKARAHEEGDLPEVRRSHRRILIPVVGMIYSDDAGTQVDGSFILAAMAAIYGDHPDYREQWRL